MQSHNFCEGLQVEVAISLVVHALSAVEAVCSRSRYFHLFGSGMAWPGGLRGKEPIGVGDRGWGLQPSQLWKNLQKSAIIGQKIGLRSGKIFINNGSSIGQPPKFYFPLRLCRIP